MSDPRNPLAGTSSGTETYRQRMGVQPSPEYTSARTMHPPSAAHGSSSRCYCASVAHPSSCRIILLDGSSKFSDKAINEQMRIEFRQSLSLTQLILLAELLWLFRIHYEDVATPYTADCCELYLLQVSTLKVLATNYLDRHNTDLGCGSIAPKSTWGKVATMGYASLGIPLTLVYLSSAGGLLSRCARGVFTRALCCCLCSNCGYCCYDERRMQIFSYRMRKKRQQEELAQQQQQQLQLQEPFYVRANASTFTSTVEIKASPKDEVSSLGSGDRPNVTILAPISICLGAMLCYIIAGAFTLHKLDGWSFIDASYFCFMSLSTIGFGDMVPGSYPRHTLADSRNVTVWFCSCYIMSGMALTAMCFNILHDEIVHRLSHQTDKPEPVKPSSNGTDENNICGTEPPTNIFAHENEINILKDTFNQVDVTRDCKPILKLEDHVPPISAVYMLPKVDEEAEENTEM
ncbi:Potassium channel subfamily K member 6 [Acromyrmex echinatior]|uniref:Potassium channel subfamily K member 6 n=1 Tax=Acromyrmex echinatior TaxID=103372 RepID=F4WCC7_ACREC|nr:Potassium channel subfamily K member 6 [Acromyrmex echinatior]